MRIIFKRIEIHNFKSFDDEVFDFNAYEGLNLVCGKNNDIPGQKNGAGKSSLFTALLFSLFGETQDSIKNANFANKYVKSKEVRVVTYFSIEDKDYKVASGFDKRGGPYCQLYELADGEEVDITRSTMTETRKYIAKELLHCDLSIFMRTIFLSSDQNYNFFRLKKWEKKEFIEKLFNIQVFGQMYWHIHKDVLEQDKLLLAQQSKIIQLNKNNEEYQQHVEKYNQDIKQKIQELNESLKVLQKKKKDLQQAEVKSNTQEVEKYETKIEQLSSATDKLSRIIDDLISKNAALKVKEHKLQVASEQKEKIVNKHSELLSKLCEDCQKIFSDYYNITTYISEIADSKAKAEEFNQVIAKNNDEIESLRKKQQACNDAIVKCQNKIKNLTAAYVEATTKIQQLDSKITIIESDIVKAEKEENPFVELLQNNQVSLNEETKILNELTEKHRYLSFAESIVSQDTLRKFIINDLIGLLNNKIKSYLSKFGMQYQVVFDSDMNYTFTSPVGTCEYDNFSGGERARLMIAACFAFRDFMYIRNNFSSNILILDEFIDGAIDSLAIESIMNILKDFSTTWNQNVFVISHRKEISNDIFDHIIQVVKTKNISKVVCLE